MNIFKVTHYLIDNQPEEWDELAAIYDKDGEYKRSYVESKMRDQKAADTNNDGGAVNDDKLKSGPNDKTN